MVLFRSPNGHIVLECRLKMKLAQCISSGGLMMNQIAGHWRPQCFRVAMWQLSLHSVSVDRLLKIVVSWLPYFLMISCSCVTEFVQLYVADALSLHTVPRHSVLQLHSLCTMSWSYSCTVMYLRGHI